MRRMASGRRLGIGQIPGGANTIEKVALYLILQLFETRIFSTPPARLVIARSELVNGILN